jgi:hypothetical protein
MAQSGIVGSDVRFKCDYNSGLCPRNCYRPLGREHRLESILSIQAERVVSNDYVVRFRKRFYQLLPPVHPGERGGRVVIEERLDGSMAIRFGKHYLSYQEVTDRDTLGGCAPNPPEFTAWAADASKKRPGRGPVKESGPAGIPPTAGRSGRTPAEPYPPDGADGDSVKRPFRPAKNHPWRKGRAQDALCALSECDYPVK